MLYIVVLIIVITPMIHSLQEKNSNAIKNNSNLKNKNLDDNLSLRKDDSDIDLDFSDEVSDSSDKNSYKVLKRETEEKKTKAPEKKKKQKSVANNNIKKKEPVKALRRQETPVAPSEEAVKNSFTTSTGMDSHYYIEQHVQSLKVDKVDFKTMKTKYIESSTTTSTETKTTETSNTVEKINPDEPLWSYGDVAVTESESYMYKIIETKEGVKVDEPTPPPTEGGKENIITETWHNIWKKYFNSIERPMCKENPNIKFKIVPPVPENSNFYYDKLPSVKPNVHYNYFGYEDSAYLFDYLDYLLQKRLGGAFRMFWTEVKQLPPKIGIDDPYSPYNQVLLYYLAQNVDSKLKIEMPKTTDTEEDLLNLLSKIRKDFKKNEYRLGISVPKLALVYEKFRWFYNPAEPDFFKKKFDKYDFDGDGRLGAREFLFLTIWENKRYIHSDKIDFPFFKLVRKYIDPIFFYADCSSVGYVDASQLWRTFKSLKRSLNPQDDELYNIFKCEFPNGDRRTASVNDLILKNSKEVRGYLNKDEFATAILLGYWDRQVAGDTIYLEDEKNMKTSRWENKKIDLECDKIRMYSGISNK